MAGRLATDSQTQVLLLEADGDDLKPNVLIAENWCFNQGGEMDWNFTAEPSDAVNNRSLHQAMGKALGGGTSIIRPADPSAQFFPLSSALLASLPALRPGLVETSA